MFSSQPNLIGTSMLTGLCRSFVPDHGHYHNETLAARSSIINYVDFISRRFEFGILERPKQHMEMSLPARHIIHYYDEFPIS